MPGALYPPDGYQFDGDSLTNMSAVGVGGSVNGALIQRGLACLILPSAALTAGTVVLEGTVDGANWYTIASLNLAGVSSPTMMVPNPPGAVASQLRARIEVAVVGGTITALCILTGTA